MVKKTPGVRENANTVKFMVCAAEADQKKSG